ncbi:Asp-tRNA(Asn)/Glu-tRNA(Gln) amidotransferase subunit GatC [Candidatus Uhrbacteria bacterium]|nr:Asp-tRNA(Asn)/Glu-tRNA(Gln) amidotransferase subunit GatC [Candidatus Uhrbacteria bacterium]
MPLTKKDVEHIARLARLELTEDEKALFSEQLSSVLSYVDQLKEVDTSGVQYGYQVDGLDNVMDEDVVRPCSDETQKLLLEAMPDRAGDLLKVKNVFS